MSAPDEGTWRRLLAPALRIVDSLVETGYGPLEVRMGGGTVLMMRFGHRISKDIDLFFYDAQALSFLSPRLNELAAGLASSYEEQANAIKLVLPDGDIDFIVAASLIPDGRPEAIEVDGRTVLLEPTAEILAKKLFYRADAFKARDTFDMAAALKLDPAAAHAALAATRIRHPALIARLRAMKLGLPEALGTSIIATELGRSYLGGMVDAVMAAIDAMGSERP